MSISGEPGAGKTTLAAHAPDPVFIDTGEETMVLAYTEGFENFDRIYHVKTHKDVSEINEAIKDGKIKCSTLILDNMSDLQFLQLDYTSELLKTGRNRADTIIPIQEDYNISTAQCRKLIRDWMQPSYPCDVIVIVHRAEITNEKTQQTIVRASLTPKLSNYLFGSVSMALFLEAKPNSFKGTERTLRANPTTVIQAKNRVALPDTFPAEKLWATIEERR
jgi:hypothetical protein